MENGVTESVYGIEVKKTRKPRTTRKKNWIVWAAGVVPVVLEIIKALVKKEK